MSDGMIPGLDDLEEMFKKMRDSFEDEEDKDED